MQTFFLENPFIERIRMSGHSHWATIKHTKGAADAKRGKVFSKMSKNIILAVRDGGADPTTNSKLRDAIDKARGADMPKANIERTIKKASGEEGAEKLLELTYEGYGPGGTAVMVDVVTDNRNRTASELRKIFDNSGGKMGEAGCVGFMFEKKAFFTVPVTAVDEEKLMNIIMEAEAENMEQSGEFFEVTGIPSNFHKIKSALEAAELKPEVSEIIQMPKNMVEVSEENAKKVLNLIAKIEDHDDVQNVFTNGDIAPEIMAKFAEE